MTKGDNDAMNIELVRQLLIELTKSLGTRLSERGTEMVMELLNVNELKVGTESLVEYISEDDVVTTCAEQLVLGKVGRCLGLEKRYLDAIARCRTTEMWRR